MTIIAAVSENWGLGKSNELLFHIKHDMERFKFLTLGGTVIMGRKTLDSLPRGKALPLRRNIVITRDRNFRRKNTEVAHSVEEALAMVKDDDPDRVWVIGGGEIYKAMLPYCSKCYITHVHAAPECDVFFPQLLDADWKVTTLSNIFYEGDLSFQFVIYDRKEQAR